MGHISLIVIVISSILGVTVFVTSSIMLSQVREFWGKLPWGTDPPAYKALATASSFGLIGGLFQFAFGFFIAYHSIFRKSEVVKSEILIFSHFCYCLIFVVAFSLGIHYNAHGDKSIITGRTIYFYESGHLFLSVLGVDWIVSFLVCLVMKFVPV